MSKAIESFDLAPAAVTQVNVDVTIGTTDPTKERPRQLIFHNLGSDPVLVYGTDIKEPVAIERGGLYLAAGQTAAIQARSVERPFARAHAKRLTGTGAVALKVSALDYELLK